MLNYAKAAEGLGELDEEIQMIWWASFSPAESVAALKSDEDTNSESVGFLFWRWGKKRTKEQGQIQRSPYSFTLLLFFNNRGSWEIFIVLRRLRKEAKERLCWLGRFGHRLDPWRGDKGELESRMVGLVGEEGGAFSEMGRMAWFEKKNDLGRGNWCGI